MCGRRKKSKYGDWTRLGEMSKPTRKRKTKSTTKRKTSTKPKTKSKTSKKKKTYRHTKGRLWMAKNINIKNPTQLPPDALGKALHVHREAYRKRVGNKKANALLKELGAKHDGKGKWKGMPRSK